MNHIEVIWIMFLISIGLLCAFLVVCMVSLILDRSKSSMLKRKLTRKLKEKRK